MRSLLPAVFVALLAAPVAARAQAAVPVHQEPRHRLVLDSTRFRVLDVQITPGDTTRFHIHDTPILYVALGISPTTAQPKGGEWPSPPFAASFASVGAVRIDSTYRTQPLTHRVTNVGAGLFRLLAITSAGPGRATSPTEPHGLPGRVELRSTWFDQTRVPLAGGAMTEWSVAVHPTLLVQLHDTKLVLVQEGGARQPFERAGSWALVPAGARYRITNAGRDHATAVAVAIRGPDHAFRGESNK